MLILDFIFSSTESKSKQPAYHTVHHRWREEVQPVHASKWTFRTERREANRSGGNDEHSSRHEKQFPLIKLCNASRNIDGFPKIVFDYNRIIIRFLVLSTAKPFIFLKFPFRTVNENQIHSITQIKSRDMLRTNKNGHQNFWALLLVYLISRWFWSVKTSE